ncbi:hypothetical protein MJO28_001511 [Puccinia striiformis f. sp. tritici]|uniref:DUF159 domain protein n=2 Tax=Puccinia striiformis f. sp. tritici TaxID=168172 RepID=A0A0L0UWZ9_9BASI|nr:hypothetical protein Pst134EB_004291 [Puccinia striiformis f. sp. tritici]KAI7961022.1 hypothetical protein MJO28_001511 [Puccinia striiformis f. sp. tritici]KAI7965795.1 hypothetical protein MJO29_001543 [Puccinia striiformis f. sp. tritici]KAI9620538.1 hypothetical protein KEM48_008075 [Puccinia striiformis f. sp. tritici PST-130]KNE91567.1 hypothetical protein PSTG_15019 [Puccinia striiformis f. sp. tritici PST-78]
MCGRFALSLNVEDLDVNLKDLQLHVDSWLNAEEYSPSYNLAPQNKAAVIRRINPSENRLGIDCMKWGLVPHWTESAPLKNNNVLKTINARDDKVIEPRGLWNSVKGQKRCIVLCEGFFEWLDKGKDKIPHFVKRTDHQLMCLAGLWDSVTFKGSTEELHTFTIITTSSNKYLSFLHDRMPVILSDRESMEEWMDVSSGEWSNKLGRLLKPFDLDNGLIAYPVPKEVGKVGNQSPDFLRPISQRKGNIMSFFKQQVSPSKPSSSSKSGTSSSNPKAKITAKKGSDGSDSDHVVSATTTGGVVQDEPITITKNECSPPSLNTTAIETKTIHVTVDPGDGLLPTVQNPTNRSSCVTPSPKKLNIKRSASDLSVQSDPDHTSSPEKKARKLP